MAAAAEAASSVDSASLASLVAANAAAKQGKGSGSKSIIKVNYRTKILSARTVVGP